MVSYSQAVLTALPYSGSITVQLATGGSFAFPIQGTYEGYTYSPIVSLVPMHQACSCLS